MAQIFHRSTNTISRVTIFGSVFIAGFILWVIGGIVRAPYATDQNVTRDQPVPFSHQHHVAGLGIDCRYCHTSVEESNFAGLPPTATCMNCHAQIWTNANMLEPVRASFASGKPLVWSRVHRLPQFVRFNHSIHVAKGIGCASCHGRIDRMALTYQAAPLTMEWCLSCHRAPENFVRPRGEVFNMAYEPANQEIDGPRLVKEYKIQKLTTCSTCHY
ncbi:MAG TPA: cytochrome c3 family protein [Thermoanaerobaculia bacterium]|nr:cytochrome c3 family protein [Thermoanaerobaculia bacterium]